MAKKKIAKTSATKPQSKKPKKKAASRPSSADHLLREHILYLLNGGGAHADFDAAIGDWPVQLAGVRVANFPHTAWMLLEHMRLAQWDILEFSRNPNHESPKWPEGYWPESEAPPTEKAWTASMAAFKKDLKTMASLASKQEIDLYVPIPWGDGQTVLREALLVADHNAYHLGQLVMLRKSIGI